MKAPAPPPPGPAAGAARRFFEEHHAAIQASRRRHRYYYDRMASLLRVRVPAGQRVLELGCGAGHLLAALDPAVGVGVDLSEPAVAEARERYGERGLRFVAGDLGAPDTLAAAKALAGGPFDTILLVNVVTHLDDVQRAFEALHPLCHDRTRVLVYSYSRLWHPVLRMAEALRLKLRQPGEAWLPPEELRNLLALADFEVVRDDRHLVFPLGIPGFADLVNRYVGHLPGVDHLSLMFGLIARPSPARTRSAREAEPTVSVVIPCRNEAGHIRPLVERLPALPAGSEFLFVEGNSEDDTEAVIRQVIAENPGRPFRFLKQTGRGKGDAVRLAFAAARAEVLIILDSDMGVAPEDLPKFVEALARGHGEFINGSRMVYPMEGQAMRFLNLLANKAFAWLFSWLLGQQVRDTLCGTKALFRRDYDTIAANRAYFGDFDPFGDFDLLFGASRLNLRIVDLAVRYHQRTYGETNISRFRHGWLLARMSAFAARKLKLL